MNIRICTIIAVIFFSCNRSFSLRIAKETKNSSSISWIKDSRSYKLPKGFMRDFIFTSVDTIKIVEYSSQQYSTIHGVIFGKLDTLNYYVNNNKLTKINDKDLGIDRYTLNAIIDCDSNSLNACYRNRKSQLKGVKKITVTMIIYSNGVFKNHANFSFLDCGLSIR